jgi:hypothetical protein
MTLALESTLLAQSGFRHAFFTRGFAREFGPGGGASALPFGPLNFAISVGDAPESVRANIALASAHLGVAVERLYFLSQTHGVAAHALDGTEAPLDVVKREGDITLSHTSGVACGVRTADCVAVLIADPESGAVAAVHSGWRGTEQNIVSAAIDALATTLQRGSETRLIAAVGPHIEACCFEVGVDVAKRLAAASWLGERVVSRRAGDKAHVDLRAIVRAQLEARGVSAIDDVRGCTCCDATRFHSFRRDAKKSGRLLAAIVARASI